MLDLDLVVNILGVRFVRQTVSTDGYTALSNPKLALIFILNYQCVFTLPYFECFQTVRKRVYDICLFL